MVLNKALLIALCLVSSTYCGVIKNRCAPLFTKDNSVAFDLNQVKPSDSKKPENITIGAIQTEFLMCTGVPDNIVDPLWGCTYKPAENLAYILDGGKCYPITTPSSDLTHTILTNTDKEVTGLVMTYSNLNQTQDVKSKLYSKDLKIVVNCNKDINNENASWTADNTDPKYLVFTTSVKAGCGHQLKDFFALFEQNRYLFGVVFFILGVLFTFFGKRFFTITLTLTGFLIGFLAIAGVAYLFSAMQKADSTKIAVLMLIAVLLGILTGYIFYRFKVVTTMAAVGILFFFIGSAIIRLYLS